VIVLFWVEIKESIMADFCKQCSIDLFGEDFKDFVYKRDTDLPAGMGWGVICEGCGMTVVNDDGECINKDCPVHGGLIPNPSDVVLRELQTGDFEDNNPIDTACARRLLRLCDDYGGDGVEAKNFLRLACRKLEVYI
jgi:hypothetical protein